MEEQSSAPLLIANSNISLSVILSLLILITPACLNWWAATPDSPRFPPFFWNIVLIFDAVLFLLSVKASTIIAAPSGPNPS